MKNTSKIYSGIFLFALTLNSCSIEQEEPTALSALDHELSLEHKGVLEVESNTYIFKNSGETVKFVENYKQFEFKFENEISHIAERGFKHEGESLTVTNPNTGEYLIYSNFKELKSGGLKFDAELSTGQIYRNMIYRDKNLFSPSQKWHEDPPRALTGEVLEAMIEISQQDLNSNCVAAINVCAKGGGRTLVSLDIAHFWFKTPAACRVGCN